MTIEQYGFLAECVTALSAGVVAVAAWRGVNAWKKQLHGTNLYDQSIELHRRVLAWRDIIFELRYKELSVEELHNPRAAEIMKENYTPYPKLDGTQTNEEARKTDEDYSNLRRVERRQEKLQLARMALGLRVGRLNNAQAEVYATSRELEVLQETRHQQYIEEIERIAFDIYSSAHASHDQEFESIQKLRNPKIYVSLEELHGPEYAQDRAPRYESPRSRWDRTPDEAETEINKRVEAIQHILKKHV